MRIKTGGVPAVVLLEHSLPTERPWPGRGTYSASRWTAGRSRCAAPPCQPPSPRSGSTSAAPPPAAASASGSEAEGEGCHEIHRTRRVLSPTSHPPRTWVPTTGPHCRHASDKLGTSEGVKLQDQVSQSKQPYFMICVGWWNGRSCQGFSLLLLKFHF